LHDALPIARQPGSSCLSRPTAPDSHRDPRDWSVCIAGNWRLSPGARPRNVLATRIRAVQWGPEESTMRQHRRVFVTALIGTCGFVLAPVPLSAQAMESSRPVERDGQHDFDFEFGT